MALRTLDENTDWVKQGDVITGKGEGVAILRGLQADLNLFADTVGFEPVKVDGKLGPRSMTALKAVYDAAVKQTPTLAGTLVPVPSTVEDTAKYALHARDWLDVTARKALSVGTARRYHFGHGKDWNVKDAIAFGAGAVHDDFKGLQTDLNKFAAAVGFHKLDVDGFLGPKSAAAVKAVYDAAVKKNPLLAVTAFPVPDTKEEAAEYCQFIRGWLGATASKALLGEAGA